MAGDLELVAAAVSGYMDRGGSVLAPAGKVILFGDLSLRLSSSLFCSWAGFGHVRDCPSFPLAVDSSSFSDSPSASSVCSLGSRFGTGRLACVVGIVAAAGAVMIDQVVAAEILGSPEVSSSERS